VCESHIALASIRVIYGAPKTGQWVQAEETKQRQLLQEKLGLL